MEQRPDLLAQRAESIFGELVEVEHVDEVLQVLVNGFTLDPDKLTRSTTAAATEPSSVELFLA